MVVTDVNEQALADLGSQHNRSIWASTLFAARVRGMRPMRLAYPKDSPEVAALFERIGARRPSELSNERRALAGRSAGRAGTAAPRQTG